MLGSNPVLSNFRACVLSSTLRRLDPGVTPHLNFTGLKLALLYSSLHWWQGLSVLLCYVSDVSEPGESCVTLLYKCYLFRTTWSGPGRTQIDVDWVSSGRAWESVVLCWKGGAGVRRGCGESWPDTLWGEKCRKVTGRQDGEHGVLKHTAGGWQWVSVDWGIGFRVRGARSSKQFLFMASLAAQKENLIIIQTQH